jgi:hypothetical protein
MFAGQVMTGPTLSADQVTVLDTDTATLPQASVAVQVLVCEREQPVITTVPVLAAGVTGPQLSVAVAVPSAASMAAAVGLQASVKVVPVAVITGASESRVQVTVLDTDAATLPQASVAVQVLVCEREQPVITTEPVLAAGVTGPQLSVAVAVPRAASMAAAIGLQPSVKVVPVAVITGASESRVQVTILETDTATLPQASVAVQVLLCEREQPIITTEPVLAAGVTGPQLSVAVAVPRAESIAPAVGLQASVKVVPVAVMTGASESRVQVTVLDTDTATLPQASVAVHVLVCEREQPVAVTVPVEAVGVTGPQASVAVAVPSAESIAPAVGLHASVNVVPVAVITGATVSKVQVTVRETAIAALPQASTAVQVLV